MAKNILIEPNNTMIKVNEKIRYYFEAGETIKSHPP